MATRKRRYRWLVVIGIFVALLLGTTYGILRVYLEGPEAGDRLASYLNKRMRGRIEVGSIEWPANAVENIATGGWVPLTLRDIRVWDDRALSSVAASDPDELRRGDPNEDCTPDEFPDPDPHSKRRPRRLLVRTDRVTTEVDLHAFLFENRFAFRNLWIHGGEALIEQTLEPYPLHAYDLQIVSIVTAFYPRLKAGFRAGIFADEPPPIFDLRDIHAKDLNLTIYAGPLDPQGSTVGYTMTTRIEGVDIDAGDTPKNDSYLYMDPIDPLVAKFYVRLSAHGKRGTLRARDRGPRESFHIPPVGGEPYPPPNREALYEMSFVDIDLKRLAQMPTEWPRKDYVANTLEIDGTVHSIPCPDEDHGNRPGTREEGAELHIFGEVLNYWDRPYDGSWNLTVDGKNMGPTIHTCIKEKVSGSDVQGRITLTGPFVARPKVGLDLRNVDLDVPIETTVEPLHLTLAEVHGSIDLVNDTGKINKTRALVRNGKEPGELELSALFSILPYSASATVDIIKPIDASKYLGPKLTAAAGGMVMGHLHAAGDVDVAFALDELDLSLGPTVQARTIRVHDGRIFTKDKFNSISIEKVKVQAGSSRATIDGVVDIANKVLHQVVVDGDFPDLGVWLERLGFPAFARSAGGGRIVIDGQFSDPTIDINTTLAGVPCLDKLTLSGRAKGDILDVPRMSTAAFGGQLTGNARIRLGDVPVIETLHLAGNNLAVARLCGMAGRATGVIDRAELDLHGSVDKNRPIDQWLELASAYVKAPKLEALGEVYSNVSLCLNRKDDAACRPRGQSGAHLDDDDLSQCEAGKKGGFCAVVSATRDAGGKLDATIVKLPPQRVGKTLTPVALGGTIAMEDLPMTVLEKLVGKGTAGGMLSATLHLSGTPSSPQASGAIELLRAWALGSFVGDSQLAIEPATLEGGAAGVSLRGSALAGRLVVSAKLGTRAPYPVELSVQLRRVDLDPFVDLAKLAGSPDPITAWASGTVTVKTVLAPPPGTVVEPEAWVELTELEATVAHRTTDGQIVPLAIAAKPQAGRPAVSLHVTPNLVEVACRDAHAGSGAGVTPCNSQLTTPVGDIELSGRATQAGVAIVADGELDFARLGGLLDTVFDDIRGKARLHAQVTGTMKAPRVEVALELAPRDPRETIQVRPVGTDTVIRIPNGLVKLANGSLGFNDVTLDVVDERAEEQGKLVLHGAIGLDGLTPASWGLYLEGKIAGKLLTAIAPKMVSQASGVMTIGPSTCPADEDGTVPESCGSLTLTGRGKLPLVDGTLSFTPAIDATTKRRVRPITLIARGVRREIAFVAGSVDIATQTSGEHRTYKLEIGDVFGDTTGPSGFGTPGLGATMTIDGTGIVSSIAGPIELRDGKPTSAHVTFDASNIPFRLPGTFDLTLSAQRVAISLDDERLGLSGTVSVIDGVYTRNYELFDAIKPTAQGAGPAKPFWEEYPAIGAATLDLFVDVRKFEVRNNIANPIDLHGSIAVSGTAKAPNLDGEIDVDRGTFRIPGTRANFTRTTGAVRFTPTTSAGNPSIDVTSDADYRDLSGQDHVITLTISGTLGNPAWDLKTSTGYDKSQTLALLVLGRNPEQLRRSLGDQNIGTDPTRVDPTTNPSASAADQIVKDLAGDWVSGLLGTSLTKLTRVDVLRFELGFGSIGVHAEKKVFENLALLGDAELTTRGYTINGRGVVRTPWKIITNTDRIELQASGLRKSFLDPAEQDIDDVQGKFVYKLFIP